MPFASTRQTHLGFYGLGPEFCWNLPSTSCNTAAWNPYCGAWVTGDESDKCCHSRMFFLAFVLFFDPTDVFYFCFVVFLSNKLERLLLFFVFVWTQCFHLLFFAFLEFQNRCMFFLRKKLDGWFHGNSIYKWMILEWKSHDIDETCSGNMWVIFLASSLL